MAFLGRNLAQDEVASKSLQLGMAGLDQVENLVERGGRRKRSFPGRAVFSQNDQFFNVVVPSLQKDSRAKVGEL